MCLEDLRIGRGKQIEIQATNASFAAGDVVLPSNPMRTAVVISVTSTGAGVVFGFSSDRAGLKPIVTLNDIAPYHVIMRVEDFGQLLTDEWRLQQIAGAPSFWIASVQTQINAPPIER